MSTTFAEAFRTNQFTVEISGIESPAVTKVTGLTEGEVDSIDQPDGGTGHIHKISSGIVKFGDLTLERNLDGTKADMHFKDWFSEMFALDGSGLGSNLRRNGSVVVRQSTKEVARWVFEGAWVKSSKFSDLDAGTSSLLKQTVVLAVERMYRP